MGEKQNGPFQLSFNAVKGCYPKSVVALDALWMLELASQRGFRERARCGVSAPLNPRNVDGAGFFGSLRRNAESSKRPEPAPGAESAADSSESRDIWHARGSRSRAPTTATSSPLTITPCCCLTARATVWPQAPGRQRAQSRWLGRHAVAGGPRGHPAAAEARQGCGVSRLTQRVPRPSPSRRSTRRWSSGA